MSDVTLVENCAKNIDEINNVFLDAVKKIFPEDFSDDEADSICNCYDIVDKKVWLIWRSHTLEECCVLHISKIIIKRTPTMKNMFISLEHVATGSEVATVSIISKADKVIISLECDEENANIKEGNFYLQLIEGRYRSL